MQPFKKTGFGDAQEIEKVPRPLFLCLHTSHMVLKLRDSIMLLRWDNYTHHMNRESIMQICNKYEEEEGGRPIVLWFEPISGSTHCLCVYTITIIQCERGNEDGLYCFPIDYYDTVEAIGRTLVGDSSNAGKVQLCRHQITILGTSTKHFYLLMPTMPLLFL